MGRNGSLPGSYFQGQTGQSSRMGDSVVVPAGQTLILPIRQDIEQHQWKVIVTVPGGQLSPVDQRAWINVDVIARIENETVLRRARIGEIDSAYFYVSGRSLELSFFNALTTMAVTVTYQVTEDSGGVGRFNNMDTFAVMNVERTLVVPPFCATFQLFTRSALDSILLSGYFMGIAGVESLVYREALAGPRSAEINRVPCLRYTLQLPPLHIVNVPVVVYYANQG